MNRAKFMNKKTSFKCQKFFTLINDKDIETLINEIEKLLYIEDALVNTKSFNGSYEILNLAGKMFLYLNSCPKEQTNWIRFYKDLISKKSITEIILTLNRLQNIKVNEDMKHVNMIASKTLDYISAKLSLKYTLFKKLTLREYKFGFEPKLTKGSNGELFKYGDLINHPVHIIDKRIAKKSISALIPFCEFGGNMSLVGVKMENFSMPVCSAFEPKVLYDQLCYEIDLEKFRDYDDIVGNQLKKGFVFIMDYNEDRQVTRKTNAGVSILYYKLLDNSLLKRL